MCLFSSEMGGYSGTEVTISNMESVYQAKQTCNKVENLLIFIQKMCFFYYSYCNVMKIPYYQLQLVSLVIPTIILIRTTLHDLDGIFIMHRRVYWFMGFFEGDARLKFSLQVYVTWSLRRNMVASRSTEWLLRDHDHCLRWKQG